MHTLAVVRKFVGRRSNPSTPGVCTTKCLFHPGLAPANFPRILLQDLLEISAPLVHSPCPGNSCSKPQKKQWTHECSSNHRAQLLFISEVFLFEVGEFILGFLAFLVDGHLFHPAERTQEKYVTRAHS